MAKKKEGGLSKFKERKKKVSLLRVGILILLIVVAIFLAKSIANIISLQNEKVEAEKKNENLTRQVEILTNELENINSDEYIELLARRNLKLIKKKETLFILPSFEAEAEGEAEDEAIAEDEKEAQLESEDEALEESEEKDE